MKKLRELLSQTQGWIDGREEYIRNHNLNPRIALPQSNWQDRPEYTILQRLHDGDLDLICNLRHHFASATGYRIEKLDTFKPPDLWYYKYIGATLFIPREIVYSLPNMLGEKGWLYKGTIVNHDAYAYQERLNLMWESGIINLLKEKSDLRILEIGAGWGGLARHLKQILPNAEYYIVDLPEILSFAMTYLRLTLPHMNFNYVPNYQFRELSGKFDLVINTLSMNEMSIEQVKDYAEAIKDLIGDDGLFFEQNQTKRSFDASNKSFHCKEILKHYFPNRKTIRPRIISPAHGTADIWANGDIESIVSTYVPRLKFFVRPLLIKCWLAIRYPSSVLAYIVLMRR